MKIAMCQMEVIPYRPDKNYARMVEMTTAAKSKGAEMVIFPELCIPGYLIGDAWEEKSYIYDCMRYGDMVRELADGIIIVFGNVVMDPSKKNTDGRPRKYNALYRAENKKFTQWGPVPWSSIPVKTPYYIKTLLPNYREFEEPRHFSFTCDNGLKQPFGLIDTIGHCVCEELWDDDYPDKPVERLVSHGAKLIVNISGSPYTIGKNRSRKATAQRSALDALPEMRPETRYGNLRRGGD